MLRWLRFFDRDLWLVWFLSIGCIALIFGYKEFAENITTILSTLTGVFSGYSALKSIRGNTPQSQSAIRPSDPPKGIGYRPGFARRWLLRPFQFVFDFFLDLFLLAIIATFIFSFLIILVLIAFPEVRSDIIQSCYAVEVIDLGPICNFVGAWR